MIKFSTKAKADEDLGFGKNPTINNQRLLNKDGSSNIRRKGLSYFKPHEAYNSLIFMKWSKFWLIILCAYLMINFIFASVYFSLGMEHLNGANGTNDFELFFDAFFFSAQTISTVGYGHISPDGFATSTIAAIEALFGLLSFAIATGLFYGRFSKPKAHILFSQNAVIAPYGTATALMMRITPYKNANLTDVEAKITLGLQLNEKEKVSNKFYVLDLEMNRVNSLNLSWTLVHPIAETSPLFGLTESDYKNSLGEIIVFIKAFDDLFSATVVKRTSYIFEEVVYGAKFNPMFSRSTDDSRTLLHIDKLNSFEPIEL